MRARARLAGRVCCCVCLTTVLGAHMLALIPLPPCTPDWARVAAAVGADLQKGVPHEVRAKALEVLPALPPARLAALLADGKLVERLVSACRGRVGVVCVLWHRAGACRVGGG